MAARTRSDARPAVLAIAAGCLRAEIVPSVGGGLARFDRLDGAAATPVLRPWPAEGTRDPNALACYPLVPWSNRISGGGFRFDGAFHALPANVPGEPSPIHGNGWTSRWRLVEAEPSRAVVALDSDGPGPFRYRATLAHGLDAAGLSMALAVTNRAEIALPFGLGFHPWLPRTAGTRLEAPATAVWREGPGHLRADDAPVPVPPEWDFTAPRALPQGWINNAFAGWSGEARIAWPDRGIAATVTAEPPLSTYVVYSPDAAADFLCFEPVSHPVDAHHLPGGPEAHGLVRLAPGESLRASCRIDVATL